MSVGIYMDVQVPASITHGLRRRGVNVLTAQEDGAREWSDEQLLARVGELKRLLFTLDTDFLAEATSRQESAQPFATVIYRDQIGLPVARCIDDLALIAEVATASDCQGKIFYLPLSKKRGEA